MQKYKKIECLYMHECIKGMINNRSCYTYDACSLNLLMWLMFGKKNFDDIISPLGTQRQGWNGGERVQQATGGHVLPLPSDGL